MTKKKENHLLTYIDTALKLYNEALEQCEIKSADLVKSADLGDPLKKNNTVDSSVKRQSYSGDFYTDRYRYSILAVLITTIKKVSNEYAITLIPGHNPLIDLPINIYSRFFFKEIGLEFSNFSEVLGLMDSLRLLIDDGMYA